ncbi:MAG: hypothetical protein ACYTXA_12105, partial [Nostoc sp.]
SFKQVNSWKEETQRAIFGIPTLYEVGWGGCQPHILLILIQLSYGGHNSNISHAVLLQLQHKWLIN